MLKVNYFLKELYIRENKISSVGGLVIFESIFEEDNLNVLDISWNVLGCRKLLKKKINIANNIALILEANKNLVHLDISHNKLDKLAFEIISEALTENHSIFGFHYEGNYGMINS